jgi:hypothetical protein
VVKRALELQSLSLKHVHYPTYPHSEVPAGVRYLRMMQVSAWLLVREDHAPSFLCMCYHKQVRSSQSAQEVSVRVRPFGLNNANPILNGPLVLKDCRCCILAQPVEQRVAACP